MERNKLADILEASLKKENLIEPQIPEPPPAPRSPPKQRVFKFSNDFGNKDAGVGKEKIVETPKFSEKQNENKEIIKPIQSGFFQPASKGIKKVEVPEQEKIPDILMEDEFEIDGMGEVWEYAGHSANVNNKEDSESDSDEFDPNAVVRIIQKPKSETKPQEKPSPSAIVQKPTKNKRVDLQTRKLIAEAKIQQTEMKAPAKLVEKAPVEEEIIVNVSNEWDNISIREIEEVKFEKKIEELGFFNRNISVNDVLQFVESIYIEVQPSPKQSFFRKFFSCFRVKSKSRTFLSSQKQKIHKFSLIIFDKNDNLHVSILKKIYCLLKEVDNCPLEGNHWREIGFQGKHPENDLRKVGLFGLFCILYFFEKYWTHAKKIYEFSQKQDTKFPFASICINFSEVALDAMDSNILLKEFEKAERVYETVLDYFCGLMIYWIRYFTEINGKIIDFMQMKDQVINYAEKHISEILYFSKLKV